MKKQIRILGIDDSPFRFTDKYGMVIGAVMRGGQYLECVLRRHVLVDGKDSTFVCKDMINKTKHKKQLRAVIIDGIALGGFNVIDLNDVFESTEIPIITVTRDMPNFDNIKEALKKNFNDWKERYELISKGELHEIKTEHNPIYVKFTGIDLGQTKEIIKLSTIRGVIPEPVRVAHLIASGVARGESYGKA